MGMCDAIKALPKRRNFYPTLAICCSVAALILTSLSSFACWFVTVDLTALPDDEADPIVPPGLEEAALEKFRSYSMGMWGHETAAIGYSYCVLYSSAVKDYFFDAYWRASRAFALIAPIFGLIAMVVTILHACTREPITNRNLMPSYCFVAAMQALAFLAYGSDICKRFNCQYSDGSTYAIVAIVLYLMAGMFHFCIYKQEVNKKEEEVVDASKEEVVEIGQDGDNDDDEELQAGAEKEQGVASTKEPKPEGSSA